MIFEFTDEAKEDLIEIYQFIGKQSVLRKQRFTAEFRECLTQIEDSPTSWPIVAKGIRVRAMKRFGFGIYFRHDKNENVIGAIIHLKRRGRGIRKRFS